MPAPTGGGRLLVWRTARPGYQRCWARLVLTAHTVRRKGEENMAAIKSPLEGIRVLDLGRHQAGPRAAQVLARLGAEVIKIERLEGEETRHHGPFARGQSAYFVQYNSGKKSLAMDLRKEPAREILRELVKVSDVFLQNFRPGTIAKMGFGWEVLQELNPRIVMINVSAYGQFGPYSQ